MDMEFRENLAYSILEVCVASGSYEATTEQAVYQVRAMTRIGSLTSTAHFKSASEADAEAVAIAEDLAKRFDLVPEVAVQGKAWLLQTPRILGILTRCQANGDECVSLTLHDKQANSIYVSLSDPEKFAEE